MKPPRFVRKHPVFTTLAAVGGLLVGIIVVGLAGLFLNHRIESVTEDALSYDVELEDHGDDLRVAVLDLRHYHRNLYFEAQSEPDSLSRSGVNNYEGAYQVLLDEIDQLEELGIRDAGAPQPDELRQMSQDYYEDFRPAIDVYDTDQGAFDSAVDTGLADLAELEGAAQEVDRLGEELSAQSLGQVEQVTETSRWLLVAAVSGLALSGLALAYAAVRSYTNQQETAVELARVSEAKTDFIADISHELRTPLTVLRGNAELGLQIDDEDMRQEVLEEMLGESARMSRMVEDLLFLARSDSANLPLEEETVDVEPLLEGLAGRAEMLVRERGLTLVSSLEGQGCIRGDKSRIEQAVMVLVDNAAKYAPRGSRVYLSAEKKKGQLRIRVEDEGPGIPEDKLPHIFERFYRVDKARSRKQGGAGLGLSIAKTIAEIHGGRIEADNTEGGARMTLHLPLSADAEAADTEQKPRQEKARRE